MYRNSTECQVSGFSNCRFKGYTTIEEATTAWNEAVTNGTVGPIPSHHLRGISQPSTPSLSHKTAHGYNAATPAPSTPSRPTQTTPSSRASTNSSTTDWLSSLTPSVAGPSSDPPTPSSRGRAARYASIVTAIEELTLEPSFVVIQGVSPGVYTAQCVSTCLFISLRLPPSC